MEFVKDKGAQRKVVVLMADRTVKWLYKEIIIKVWRYYF